MPDWIPRAPFPASTRDGEKRTIDYPLVNDDLALLWMVNMGCIDMNAWTSRVDLPARPDWVIFDLDPSDDVGLPGGDRGGAARQGRYSTSSGSRASRRRAARAGSTCSCRSPGATATTRRESSPESSRALWRGRTRVSSRPSGRRASAGACSSTRTRTARGGRRRRSTRYDLALALPCRRRSGGTRCARDSTRSRSRFDEVRARVARDGDLFAPVLGSRQSLGAALRSLG